MKIPEFETRKLTDAERFVIGFKELCEETNLCHVKSTKLGPNQFSFKDGSNFGVFWLLNQVGFNFS